MREIKFRAWDKTEDEWIDLKFIRFDGNEIWYVQSQDEFERDIDPPFFPERNQLVLMQYTGLKDKNGVEIFEGDVVERDEDERYLVIWEEWCFNLKGFSDSYYDYPTLAFSEGIHLEVIGNVHEHPHLLEKEEK